MSTLAAQAFLTCQVWRVRTRGCLRRVSASLRGVQYTVRVPGVIMTFYRLVHDQELEASFLSNHEQGKPRRRRVEDAADHRGLSVRETLDQALSLGRGLNSSFRRAGRPEFTHVAEFLLRPEGRYACAQTGTSEGHFTAWGEANELASSIATLHPIDEGG